ncbi:hypothetical protein SDC9_176583 [bioreactor metagenome]|uniref:Uncharacterized protein n=1 Tax=bioreactor metagenome TaxID=1076179 RepID=A0A645GT52_9ZZZZ
MQGYSNGLYHRGLLKGDVVGNLVKYMCRNRNEFGKSTVFCIIPRGNTQDFSIVAEVVMPLTCEPVIERIYRGVESNPVTRFPSCDRSANFRNYACGFVPHDQRGDSSSGAPVHTVDVASADSAGLNPYQYFVGFHMRIREITIIQLHVFV